MGFFPNFKPLIDELFSSKFDNPTGTNLQYIAGDGTLLTFPTFLSSDSLIATMFNQTGSTVPSFTVVYINGVHGNLPTLALAKADSESTSSKTYAITSGSISNNNSGGVVTDGKLKNINTSAFAEGDSLWLSPTIAGGVTTTKPSSPNHAVFLGTITRVHTNQGEVQVRIQNGFELQELHNVAIDTPLDSQSLIYDNSTSLWKNSSKYLDWFTFIWKLFTGFTIDELRALTDNQIFLVSTFKCKDSNRFPTWYYDSSDTTSADNTGTILVTSSGKRLKAKVDEIFYLKYEWFDDGGTTDNTTIFANLNSQAYQLSKKISLPKNGQIIVNQSFLIRNSIKGNNCTIKLKNSSTVTNGSCILQPYSDRVVIEDIIIDGNRTNNGGTSTSGVKGIYAEKLYDLTLRKIKVINTRDNGIYINNCPKLIFVNSEIDNCGRYGSEMTIAQRDRIGVLIDNDYDDSNYFMGAESIVENVKVSNSGLDGFVLGVGIKLLNCIGYANGQEIGQTLNNDGGAGVYVRPPQRTMNAVLNGLEIIGFTASYNTGIGIDISNNTNLSYNAKVKNTLVQGCKSFNNALDGIAIGSIENTIVTNNISYNNGTKLINLNNLPNYRRAGIGLNCTPGVPQKNTIITQNICYDDGVGSAKTQQHGLYSDPNVRTNLSENLYIFDNDFSRNYQKAFYFGNSTASPVIPTSTLYVNNNIGADSYTLSQSESGIIPPVNSHIYYSPQTSADNITGLGIAPINTIVTIENISVFSIYAVNSTFLRLTSYGDLLIAPNATVTFIRLYQAGNFIWKQIPTTAIEIMKTQMNSYSKASSVSAISTADTITSAIGKIEKALPVMFSATLSGGYIEVTSSEILTTSKAIIQTVSISGTMAHDYTYDVSTLNKIKVTARNSSGTQETGCNSTLTILIKN